MGSIFKKQRRVDDAIAYYERAIKAKPELSEVYNFLGIAHKDKGDLVAAEKCYRQVVSLSPLRPEGYFNLANVLLEADNPKEAELHLWHCLELDPADRFGAHMLLARMGAADVPEKISDAQLQNLYTKRAGFWDDNVESDHSYQGHKLVANLLARLSDKNGLDILDAGCGTGLVGILVRNRATNLKGIDFSSTMLEKAKSKAIYDGLHLGDMVAFMENAPGRYDVITCAATLIHFGDLQRVFGAIATALRPDGLFIATLFPNTKDDDGFSVASSKGLARGGCYMHGRGYLRRLASEHNLKIEAIEDAIHEYFDGQPITGLVLALRK